jgi:putative peptide zinc metalloprotease protein
MRYAACFGAARILPPGMDSHPKLRSDLPISRQQTASGAVYVLKDPVSERFFRLREHEYLVARQLDGQSDLETVRLSAQEQLGRPIESDVISSFVRQLEKLHLLEHTGPTLPTSSPSPAWRNSLLYLRLKTIDPDRLLTRMVGPLGLFFTPAFVVMSAVAIILGGGIVASNRAEIWLHLQQLYRLDVLPLAWLTVLVVTVFHEFAHGLTCKHFGGQVREIGLMLLYFQPAMYCNVSDAWLFPEKSQRLWVTFAGGYFEAFLWALSAIAWRMTDAGTMVNTVALIVTATSGIKIAFNANPLIKLDGYYLLSDYLGLPNLRQRSFAYMRARLRQLWHGRTQPPDTTARERRVYVLYGLLAGAYSAWLLGLVSWHVGGFLIDRYQAPGLLVFLFLLAVAFRRATSTLVSRIRHLSPNSVARMLELRGRRWPTYSLAVPVLVLGAVVIPVELRVNGAFTILPAHNADIRAEVEGTIAEIYVDEGDSVEKGRLLARLSDRDQVAQLAAVDGAIQEKRARLKLLRAGPRGEEIALAHADVSTARTKKTYAEERYAEAIRLQAARRSSAELAARAAEERLTYARTDLDRFNELFRLGLVSRSQTEERQQQVRLLQNELERAREELTLATAGDAAQLRQEVAVSEKEAEQAQGRLHVLMAGSRREEVEAIEAEITQLVARRTFLDEQLSMATIKTPASGVVVTPRLREKVGQHVNRGDLIAEVYELKQVTAEITVSEKEIADVAVHAPVSFKARAYPERTFAGTVAAISPAAVAEGALGARVFRVRVDVDNAAAVLKPSMTGTAKISSGTRSLFSVLTRRLARVVRVEFWSWW